MRLSLPITTAKIKLTRNEIGLGFTYYELRKKDPFAQ